jgi:tetratricopeptide (TPR) repeat protein
MFLARTDRSNPPKEALEICIEAWKNCPPEAVGLVSVAILRSTRSTDDQRAEVERWLIDTISSTSISRTQRVALRANLAELQDLRGHYEDSEKSWQEVLVENRTHVVAPNNLACLIAFRHAKGTEALKALEFIDRAIAKTGPVGELLDSRAMVLLNLGRELDAIQDLESAIALKPSASKSYHLALAYQRTNKLEDAKAALKKARDLKFTKKDLHPLEWPDYDAFIGKIDSN